MVKVDSGVPSAGRWMAPSKAENPNFSSFFCDWGHRQLEVHRVRVLSPYCSEYRTPSVRPVRLFVRRWVDKLAIHFYPGRKGKGRWSTQERQVILEVKLEERLLRRWPLYSRFTSNNFLKLNNYIFIQSSDFPCNNNNNQNRCKGGKKGRWKVQ